MFKRIYIRIRMALQPSPPSRHIELPVEDFESLRPGIWIRKNFDYPFWDKETLEKFEKTLGNSEEDSILRNRIKQQLLFFHFPKV